MTYTSDFRNQRNDGTMYLRPDGTAVLKPHGSHAVELPINFMSLGAMARALNVRGVGRTYLQGGWHGTQEQEYVRLPAQHREA